MKNQLHFILLAIWFLTACQKPNESSSMILASTACQSGPSQNVAIEGLRNLKSGEITSLSLSSGINCQEAQTAQWKVGDVTIGTGPQVVTQIKGSGLYGVTVEWFSQSAVSEQSKLEADATVLSAQVAVTDSPILLVGPQVGYQDQPYTYSLSAPAGLVVTRAVWNFGDGSPLVSSLNPVQHTFSQGTFNISVSVNDQNGNLHLLQQAVQIIPIPESRMCALDQLMINGPVDVPLDRRVPYSINLNTCLLSRVTTATWNFGDGTASISGLSAFHTFTTAGVYIVTVRFALYGQTVTLSREVTVSANLEEMPGPVIDPVPTTTTTTTTSTTTTTTTLDLNKCPVEGDTRESFGETFTEGLSCGLQGQKTNTYKIRTLETCQKVGEIRDWVKTDSSKTLVQEGDCQSQACELPTLSGVQILKDGESRTLYMQTYPAGTCSSVEQTRTCSNGVLSGSAAAQALSCQNGCGEFGVHGTVKTGVVTGEVQQPVTCQFGEEGIFSTHQQLSDLTCQDGQVVSSNVRTGEVKVAGACPTYSWVATENWTQCSSDCGGSQSRVYECRNDKGEIMPSERCSVSAPVESRVCDANAAAASRIEVVTTSEEAPTCARCPANKIGVVTKTREVTTTNSYACLNHSVQLVDSAVVTGAWVKQSYCRELVPTRCSHDSLSNRRAKGRYEWMKKCQNEVPAIKEFLKNMDNSKYDGYGIHSSDRLLYPTFMTVGKKQKPWIAPTSKSAECEAPSEVYVAAVCVSSCSTPEQQILAQAESEKDLKYMSFIEALTQQAPKVATLHSASSMSSKTVIRSKVDNWVTELVDEEHQILVFRMKSGGQLKVTLNHPMLSQEGVMKLASDFRVGDSLVLLGGELDPILSIEQTVHHGKVYNLFVKSSDLKHNVVVINGYLNGTAFYQNEGARHLNRALFRQQLFRGAFDSKGRSE